MLNLSYDPVVLHSVEFLLQSSLEADAAIVWCVDRWSGISFQEEASFAFKAAYAIKLILRSSMEVTIVFCAVPAGTEQLALDLIALIITKCICSHARNPRMAGPSTSCSDKEFSERRNIQFHHRYKLLT